MPDVGRSALIVLGVNTVCLLLIVLAVVLWRWREPMAPPRLQRTLRRRPPAQAQEPPFDGSIGMVLCVMDDLAQPVDEQALVQALLTGWALVGAVRLEATEKRKLESFGGMQQATLTFTGAAALQQGAALLLFETLRGWAGADGALQESTLYNTARAQHAAVRSRLEQFTVEGRHALRARGATHPEAKKRRFGFLDERRTIYTARGVREAGQLLDYRRYLHEQRAQAPQDMVFAALFLTESDFDAAQAEYAAALARALLGGMHAGENAGR